MALRAVATAAVVRKIEGGVEVGMAGEEGEGGVAEAYPRSGGLSLCAPSQGYA